jgi:hypothetical protein
VFLLNALSFVGSALLLSHMRFAEPHLEHVPPLHPRVLVDFSPILEGLRYVRRDRRLRMTIFVKFGIGLMNTGWTLFPIFGERVFPIERSGNGPGDSAILGMSLLFAARGAGAMLGPLVGSYWAGTSHDRLRVAILLGFVLSGLGYCGLSAAPTLALACLAIILAHAGGSTVWVASTNLLQMLTGDEFRGRVFSAEFALSMLAMATVNYTAGTLIDKGAPVQKVALLTGGIVLIPAVAWAFAMRRWNQR